MSEKGDPSAGATDAQPALEDADSCSNELMAQETLFPRKFDLGPRWSSEEIQIFFESKSDVSGGITCGVGFQTHGRDWDSIVAEFHRQGFTHRTKQHAKSLYLKVGPQI